MHSHEPSSRFRTQLPCLLQVLNVQVPFLYKYAVDALSGNPAFSENPYLLAVLASPVALLASYGVLRATASLSNELRNAVFANVAQGTIRVIAKKVGVWSVQSSGLFTVVPMVYEVCFRSIAFLGTAALLLE